MVRIWASNHEDLTFYSLADPGEDVGDPFRLLLLSFHILLDQGADFG